MISATEEGSDWDSPASFSVLKKSVVLVQLVQVDLADVGHVDTVGKKVEIFLNVDNNTEIEEKKEREREKLIVRKNFRNREREINREKEEEREREGETDRKKEKIS